jgi:hypothetical protein
MKKGRKAETESKSESQPVFYPKTGGALFHLVSEGGENKC